MSPLEPGAHLGDRFRIDACLGRGSFGTVYRAFDPMVGTDVALKVFHPELLSARRFERVKREIRLARRARSSRIVENRELMELQGPTGHSLTVISMELVEGSDLKSVLEAEGRLAVERVLELTREILLSLDELHAVGVLHRDVKPANILISSTGEVKLTDFGLALSWPDRSLLTTTDKPVGTAAYRYPERGDDVCPASDLYSLGVVVFEMLAGRRPFEGGDVIEVLQAHLSKDPPNIRSLRPEVPRSLARWLARMLAKHPEERYSSAKAALTDLDSGRWPWILPRAWKRLLFAAAIVGGLGVSVLRNEAEKKALDHVSPWTDTRPIAGWSTKGDELWQIPGQRGYGVALRFREGRPPDAAVITFDPDEPDISNRHVLRILGGSKGAELKRFYLDPSFSWPFSQMGFSDQFHPRIQALDVDGDDLDELFVTYFHHPYWPSYTIFCDLPSGRNLPILLASGHHFVSRVIDLNGDDLPEALLIGINNLLGYRTGVAAVELPLSPDLAKSWRPASTPNVNYLALENASLLWYALLPGSAESNSNLLTVDFERQKIIIPNRLDGKSFELDFHGFLETYTGLAVDRQRARSRAYAHYRRSQDFRGVGHHAQSLEQLRAADREARVAGEAELVYWLDIVHGCTLVEMGEIEKARQWFEELFQALKDDLARADEVTFQAGKAFHLAGEAKLAVEWYQRGLGLGKPDNIGRIHWEYLQKELLAHLELEDFKGAQQALFSYHQRFPGQQRTDEIYSAWLASRRGDGARVVETSRDDRDLMRYWSLELRRQAGEPPEELLGLAEVELMRSSETLPMIFAYQAELLADLGRMAEAREAASRALTHLENPLLDPIVVRHHEAEVRERCARVLGFGSRL